MVITSEFVIMMGFFAVVGVFAFTWYIAWVIYSILTDLNKRLSKDKVQRLNFEGKLCSACRKEYIKWKIEQTKD